MHPLGFEFIYFVKKKTNGTYEQLESANQKMQYFLTNSAPATVLRTRDYFGIFQICAAFCIIVIEKFSIYHAVIPLVSYTSATLLGKSIHSKLYNATLLIKSITLTNNFSGTSNSAFQS